MAHALVVIACIAAACFVLYLVFMGIVALKIGKEFDRRFK